ncbi:Bidirectional sugar transporter SWEET4 [Dendrobium catenatum]|uniref:Bidirectional sugar transporter SWEET n=1 Tax=Dendrobium catenatum TaxID=906689 RepID=A0A2I0VIY1_9ASPA|nr:Bidirectional sugar transporter SWEET4 [Dendrobium catenatum]
MISADTLRTVVGIVGNVIALGLFFSPLPTFIRIWKKKSVEEFSVIPYVATLLNCMLWMLYGLPIVHPNSTLVLTINCAGTAIEICYVILYLVFSDGPKRLKALFLFFGDLAFVAVVAIIVLIFFHTHDYRSLIVGILCVIFCIIMYLAPLSVMAVVLFYVVQKMVIQTKSVEYMPLSLSVASFLNGLCWTIYALIRFDLYITIPNGLGLLFSITQLVLHALYYKSTKRQIAERKLKGEVGLTDVVIDDSVKESPVISSHKIEAPTNNE